jgi:hypothetical protein
MSTDLWPEISAVETTPSPRAHLQQQADALTAKTKGLLRGETILSKEGGDFYVSLNIVVPNLNLYTHTVLMATYNPLLLYPARLVDCVNDQNYECADAQEFLGDLAHILSSDGLRGVLTALLSQAKEAADEIPF